jgi:glyoxylase-like metal-dependent hydrolase (beta-lactamase superfamily II)
MKSPSAPVRALLATIACALLVASPAAGQQAAPAGDLCTVSVPQAAPAPGGRQGGGQGGGARGGAAAATPTSPSSAAIRVVKVRDDVHVIQNVEHTVAQIGALGGNVTVYLTDDGVVLVDAKNERMHDELVARVKALTDKPIKYVVLTHNHADHSAGAPGMQQIGATVVISAEDLEPLRRSASAGTPLPQVAYSRHASLLVGRKEVQLTEYCGHTRGDTVVYLPAARVLIAGDLVTTPDSIPQIVNYGDGGNWTDMLRTLNAIAAIDFEFLVGGHGPVLSKPEFLMHRDKLAAMIERVKTLVKQGRSREEITQTLRDEFHYGDGPAAGNIAGMMVEFR